MPGKGKFSGFNWHHEFHTVDPKKEKAADCIYLDKNRICRKKSCHLNGEKCFVATHCKYRVKEKDAPKPTSKPKEWTCSLPKQCTVFSKAFGIGTYINCDHKRKIISVAFDCGMKFYSYPDAFIQQKLYGNQDVSDAVLADFQK